MSRSAQLAVAAAVVVAGLGVTAWTLLGAGDDPGSAPFGLRLGMGPRDVRERLARELPGELVVVPAAELALEWHGRSPEVRSLRLELHEGKLVAIRARLAESASIAHGETLWQSSSAVLSRKKRDDGDLDFLLVARDCPTHRDEVARLLSGAAHQPTPSGTSP